METSPSSAQHSEIFQESKEDFEELPKVSLFKFDDRDSPLHLRSDVDSMMGSESYSSDSKREACPFGERYIPLRQSIINDKKKKLGIINLYWPILDSLKIFPESYTTNSNKEKVLLLYAENFRKQYHTNFPTKKPLLLAAENECGIQKMVSTAIRPTKLGFPELHTWQGCASFVSDHIVYKPLDSPHLMVRTLTFHPYGVVYTLINVLTAIKH